MRCHIWIFNAFLLYLIYAQVPVLRHLDGLHPSIHRAVCCSFAGTGIIPIISSAVYTVSIAGRFSYTLFYPPDIKP